MRLLKEYTTRELIDALSYDFDPLQGMAPVVTANRGLGMAGSSKAAQVPRGARISTVEIAIRATAKKFLAHPSVVQQLEAIWAGSIVFHTAADHLHRRPEKQVSRKQKGYGTIPSPGQPVDYLTSKKVPAQRTEELHFRRSVTLYNPRDASLFKLSRLRVPRYRQVFSTISYAVMLALFIAVLADRSLEITALEIVFWFWSAGYMLDEVVGFSEQGFGLYIMSVWNAFDLGILGLFIVYYILRIWCVAVADAHNQHRIASMAYDVLASTAILLFPRAFSVLDHYKYFSQLLIAFRLMAQDLIAILVLIIITCSGFFVCFTLSFSSETTTGTNVAFALFQIVLGFTPAAWNVWSDYNLLGQIIMGFFLTICHFLIVTILITVLTNSFMAIVQNATEEHQFLFAVNTISMVKSDALFSYIAPSNVLAWLISPIRYIIPFRKFVKLNRTVIKITHFPVLLVVFLYERLILSNITYEPTDLVERKAPVPTPGGFSLNKNLFSPGEGRLREASVVSFHKDRALDEVFRRPFQGSTIRTTAPDMEQDRRQSTDVVSVWMNHVGNEGGASPPIEQPQSELDRLETRRPPFRRAMTSGTGRSNRRDVSSASRSVLSDPEERSFFAARRPKRIEEETDQDLSLDSIPQDTEADGDDELVTGDEGDTIGKSSHALGITTDEGDAENIATSASESETPDYFATPTVRKPYNMPGSDPLSHAARARLLASTNSAPTSPGAIGHPGMSNHMRNMSNRTIVPQSSADPITSSASEFSSLRRPSRPQTGRQPASEARAQNIPSAKKTPRPTSSRARPAMPNRGAQQTAPNMRTLASFNFDQHRPRREPSFNTMALDLASDFDENRFGSAVDVGGISGMPASFSEQLFRERELARRAEAERKRVDEDEEKSMVGRIMLARMNTLEEGFREMLKEVRVMRLEGTMGSRSGTENGSAPTRSQRGSGSGLTVVTAPLSGSGSSGLLPNDIRPGTPLSRSIGSKPKKSPRKIQRRGKGKEPQGFFTSSLSETVMSPELDSTDATPMEGIQREDFAIPGTLSPMQTTNSNRASVIFMGDEENLEGSREIAPVDEEPEEDKQDKTDA